MTNQTLKFKEENIFYNPQTVNPIKLAASNLIAFTLAAVFITLFASFLTFVTSNIFVASIIGCLTTVGYVGLTTGIFTKIFK